jgi:hypothetical protein
MVLVKRMVLVVLLVLGFGNSGWGRGDTAKPLSEADLLKLVELALDDSVIVPRLEKAGVSFAVDDGVIERLTRAKASPAILAAVRKCGAAAPAITYQDVLQLVKLGINEDDLRKRLEKSPTLFTLARTQAEELKKAGASDQFLAFLKGKRNTPAEIGDITNFVLILDCSGSMADKTREGPSKMEVAKKVVSELITRIPNGRKLGFIVYGHDAALLCEAVAVLRPLSVLDDAGKDQLRQAIARLQPVGHTPIARSLQVAAQELARDDAMSGLILITDGMETCHGDPRAEAAKLAANPKLTFGFHVVGFDVDPRERQAVEGIARAGKGSFYDARSAAKLNETIQRLRTGIETGAKPAAVDRPDEERPVSGKPAQVVQPDPAPSSRVVQALIEQLTSKDARLRREAAETLGRLGAKEAVPALINRVADDVWLQRPYGSILGDSSPFDGMKDRGSKDKALEVLAKLAPDKVEQALFTALRSKTAAVRTWAISELAGKGKNEALVAALVAGLRDTDGNVRRASAETLGKLGAKEAVPALINRVADDVWLQRPYGSILGDSSPYDGMKDRGSKDKALEVLAKLAPDKVEEALLAAMQSKKPEVKAWGVAQLGNLKKP